jgi:hypothetical protein
MPVVSASGLGGLLNSAELVPYVYGAASGWPSRARPENVLANPDLPEPLARQWERAPYTSPKSPGRSASAECGTPAGARRHQRHKETCDACGVRTRKVAEVRRGE